jgi:hypothetical protein
LSPTACSKSSFLLPWVCGGLGWVSCARAPQVSQMPSLFVLPFLAHAPCHCFSSLSHSFCPWGGPCVCHQGIASCLDQPWLEFSLPSRPRCGAQLKPPPCQSCHHLHPCKHPHPRPPSPCPYPRSHPPPSPTHFPQLPPEARCPYPHFHPLPAPPCPDPVPHLPPHWQHVGHPLPLERLPRFPSLLPPPLLHRGWLGYPQVCQVRLLLCQFLLGQ